MPSENKNFSVRWTPTERNEINELAKANQLRPTDIIRIGTMRFIAEIKAKGGLVLRPPSDHPKG